MWPIFYLIKGEAKPLSFEQNSSSSSLRTVATWRSRADTLTPGLGVLANLGVQGFGRWVYGFGFRALGVSER